MEIRQYQAAVEAILFASGASVGVDRLGEALELGRTDVIRLCDDLAARYFEQGSGLRVLRLDDAYQLCTREEHFELIRRALDLRHSVPLSSAALEVLAVIAYNQPVTRAFVEQVRGVDCSGVVSSLVEKELIVERGRLDLPGRPLLYGTGDNFLRCFGLNSLADLPPLPQRPEQEAQESSPDIFKAAEGVL